MWKQEKRSDPEQKDYYLTGELEFDLISIPREKKLIYLKSDGSAISSNTNNNDASTKKPKLNKNMQPIIHWFQCSSFSAVALFAGYHVICL